jgi:hypothetical protein
MPSPVAVGSKAWVCGRSLAGIVCSNPADSIPVSCECFVLSEVSAISWTLVRSSPTKCGVSECDRDFLVMSKPWPTRRTKFGYCYYKIKWHKESIRAWNCTILRQVLLVRNKECSGISYTILWRSGKPQGFCDDVWTDTAPFTPSQPLQFFLTDEKEKIRSTSFFHFLWKISFFRWRESYATFCCKAPWERPNIAQNNNKGRNK